MKNIVIVHGALADGSGWRKTSDILVQRGFNVSIIQRPITSLADDIAATNRVLHLQGGPTLLVGHSYGMVITEAGHSPIVAGLLYVAAFQPGFAYSAAMKAAGGDGLVWGETTLRGYLHDPKTNLVGMKMAFPGLKDDQAITDLIS